MRIATTMALPAAALIAGLSISTAGVATADTNTTTSAMTPAEAKALAAQDPNFRAALMQAIQVKLATDPAFRAEMAAAIAEEARTNAAFREQLRAALAKDPVFVAWLQAQMRAAAAADMFSQSRAWASSSKARAVVNCESGGNYSINTGNGYFGGWQFLRSSWLANGGGQFASYPHYASKDQQDYVAWTYWKKAGWGPWACA